MSGFIRLMALYDTIFVIWFAGLWDQNTIKGFKDYFKKIISIHSDFKLAWVSLTSADSFEQVCGFYKQHRLDKEQPRIILISKLIQQIK